MTTLERKLIQLKELQEEINQLQNPNKLVPLENIDWKPLQDYIVNYVESLYEDGFEDDAIKQWTFEYALECVYGKDIWNRYNKLV